MNRKYVALKNMYKGSGNDCGEEYSRNAMSLAIRGMPTSELWPLFSSASEPVVSCGGCSLLFTALVCFADGDHDQAPPDPRCIPPRHPRDGWDVGDNPGPPRRRLPTVHQCRPGGENYLGSN